MKILNQIHLDLYDEFSSYQIVILQVFYFRESVKKKSKTRKLHQLDLMKENKAPLLVKLFLPQNDTINQKQLISIWGQPHPKQFQIVDNPSIINRIATEINQNRRQYNSAKIATQPSESSCNKRPLYIVKKTKKCQQRIKFSKLNQEVSCLSDFIENQVSQLSVSQIFQYKQKMLTTFLQSFFEQLERQCHEKASFIMQIWNQTMNLFDRIFQKQNENSLSYEKNSLNEILELHKSYQEIFQKLKKEKQAQINESQKFKEIIKSLVRNIRERQKQIKVYKGGIDDYNNKLNNLSTQLVDLKKEHIDILMYGHEGNMTKQQAEEMLARILKPDDQDEQDLRQFLSIKYIPPKLPKGKSEKFIKFSDQIIPENPNAFQTPDQIKKFTSCLPSVNVQLKHNFVPKKTKFREYQRCVDAQLQTDSDEFAKIKVNQSIECSYFTKMDELMIKNKYCQTQNKKVYQINWSSQTDFTEIQAFTAQKRAKLQITGNLFDANIRNSEKKSRHNIKNEKFNTTLTFLKTQYELEQHQEKDEDFNGQIHQSLKEQKDSSRKEVLQKKKQDKNFQKTKNSSTNSKNLTPIKQNVNKPSKGSLSKSIKTRMKTKPEENHEQQQMVKYFLKTQNVIKLNKMRASNQLKNKITEFFSYNNKNIMPESAFGQRRIAGLLRCYFDINERDTSEIQEVNQSKNFIGTEENSHQIQSGQTWSNRLFKTFQKITNYPSQRQLDLAFYFNTKNGKNKNISVLNKDYLQQLSNFSATTDSNGTLKKNDCLAAISVQFQTFTMKKAYKIIEQVFELCFAIRQNKDILNINFIDILERLFSPSTLATLNNSRVDSPRNNKISVKTIEFLKYLMRNMNENYLLKNFLFLCGINYRSSESKENQKSIVNINRTTHIGQRPQTKKTIHIQTAIKQQMRQKQKKDLEKSHFGTLVYSSEVVFYLEMFKAMNCYSNSMNDITNSYTTLEMLQSQFEKLAKYYKDQKLIKKIKDVIEESLRHSTLNNSKLNIFKCLQLFLEKVRERKIEMMHSYFELDEFIKEKVPTNISHYLLVEILTIAKASPETQLKIMAKMFKMWESESSLQDLMTFFVMQGFSDVQLLHQGLVKSSKLPELGTIQSLQKLNNLVLEYFNVACEKKSSLKSGKYLREMNGSLKIYEVLQKEVQQLLGQDLSRINVAHIFLVGKE